MKALVLKGHEDIDLTVTSPVGRIVLNQAGLKLEAATVDGTPLQVTQDETAQTATLTVPVPGQLPAGKHVLSIRYSGPIPQTPNGIYYDDYRTEKGKKKRMLVTQFEVADARRMFPSWDEPSFKATYQLSVRVPRSYTAVSNMPVTSVSKEKGDTKYVNFATTPACPATCWRWLRAIWARCMAWLARPPSTSMPRRARKEGRIRAGRGNRDPAVL